jgi:hypothetical protein
MLTAETVLFVTSRQTCAYPVQKFLVIGLANRRKVQALSPRDRNRWTLPVSFDMKRRGPSWWPAAGRDLRRRYGENLGMSIRYTNLLKLLMGAPAGPLHAAQDAC